jgi:hypothetical protein
MDSTTIIMDTTITTINMASASIIIIVEVTNVRIESSRQLLSFLINKNKKTSNTYTHLLNSCWNLNSSKVINL